MTKRQKDRQHNDQKTEGYTTQWPIWSLCCLSFCLLVIALSILLSFGHCVVYPSIFWSLCCLFLCLLVIVFSILLSFGHCVVYASVFWSLCCLSFFLLVIVLSFLLSFVHCVWIENTMTKRQKDRQHNDQKTEGQTTQWPKDRGIDNTLTKR
jgi:predicted membrane protein